MPPGSQHDTRDWSHRLTGSEAPDRGGGLEGGRGAVAGRSPAPAPASPSSVVDSAVLLFSTSWVGWGAWGQVVVAVSQSGLSAMVVIWVRLLLAACSASASRERRLPPLMIQSWKVIIDSSPGRVAAAAWMTARE